ncbi:MAG: KUP/HAK/KT family potassium transporter [Oligoflexia bacterium]|nr:KUP/HAK/KT family potassium transporter [Oligoflexia bacterium]
MRSRNDTQAVTAAGLLVALGIIYGDIGTSPLYVFSAIAGNSYLSPALVYGGLSAIFWTLTLQTTFKYVVLILEADNKGEGGIFSLYALVRRRARWLLLPAIIGGSALLADGIITPPISVSSAIEGLRIINPDIPTVGIVILILAGLFSFQQFGTSLVGKAFGPIMLVWFAMLGALGLNQLIQHPFVLQAINPIYALELLFKYPGGFWLLGAVFLCTTGAEAMYSDLGHCGRSNIRMSWLLVKTCLLLNYFGQGAWLISMDGQQLLSQNPFYAIVPRWFLWPSIGIATAAAVIASQALISGSFTLVTEAMRLYLFPKSKVVYPTELKGQIYVPAMNLLLFLGCTGIVLYFQHSSNMEAAYGLAITVTMMMTTVLYAAYMETRRRPRIAILAFLMVYLPLESGFLIANLSKFAHGGYVTVLVGGAIFGVMWVWQQASVLKRRYTEFVSFKEHLTALRDLSRDESVPKYSTHLAYMTGAPVSGMIESKIIYSIFRKKPKRADVYWFIHVDVLDEPYTTEYQVEPLIPGIAYRIDFMLGFRVEPRINLLFRRAIEELASSNEIDIMSRYESLRKHGVPGDFRFVVLEKALSYENALPTYEQLVMRGYELLKLISLSEARSFGLDLSSVTIERVPLVIAPLKNFDLKRVFPDDKQRHA